jgi:hypothetical protein
MRGFINKKTESPSVTSCETKVALFEPAVWLLMYHSYLAWLPAFVISAVNVTDDPVQGSPGGPATSLTELNSFYFVGV